MAIRSSSTTPFDFVLFALTVARKLLVFLGKITADFSIQFTTRLLASSLAEHQIGVAAG